MNDGLLRALSLTERDELEADEQLKRLASCPEEFGFEADDFDFEPSEVEGLTSY